MEYAAARNWPRELRLVHDGAGATRRGGGLAAGGVVVDRHEVAACSAVFHHQDALQERRNASPIGPRRA